MRGQSRFIFVNRAYHREIHDSKSANGDVAAFHYSNENNEARRHGNHLRSGAKTERVDPCPLC